MKNFGLNINNNPMYVVHKFIKPNTIEWRKFQVNIANVCKQKSTLVVLPTAMGKTVIALLLIADMLEKYNYKILFLAPTKPLVHQHYEFLCNYLNFDKNEIAMLTGEIKPAKRAALWNKRIIVSTPQVIANDLQSSRIDLQNVGLIIYDEAHRGVGDYAYVFIAEKYRKYQKLSLGMTASPGSKVEKICEVCANLNISWVEMRCELDEDVIEYSHDIFVKPIYVDLPEGAKPIIDLLKSMFNDYTNRLRGFGFLLAKKPPGIKDLLEVQSQIREKIHAGKGSAYFQAATVAAIAMKLNQAIEYTETQGMNALRNYLEKIELEAYSKGSSKAARLLVAEPRFREVVKLARAVHEEHPKIAKVVEEVKKQVMQKEDSRVIVFTQYREIGDMVTKELAKELLLRPVRFVGQADRGDDKGLKQREQAEVIQNFKNGKYNVLVATSVAEEGLDIPATDLVVFYEPIPSEIRTIQRRGRTGRARAGRVAILMTKGTRDVGYFWASKHRERRMHKIIEFRTKLHEALLKKGVEAVVRLEPTEKKEETKTEEIAAPSAKTLPAVETVKKKKGQLQITDFIEGKNELTAVQKPFIIADAREFGSEVTRHLSKLDCTVVSSRLEVGDYILSDRICVERKEVDDFLQSLIDGRLFTQLKNMCHNYPNPLLVVEGEGLYTIRQINENAIYGAFASILTDFKVPIMFTRNAVETANLLFAILKREYGEKKIPSIRADKTTMLEKERLLYIVEGLPNISGVLAHRLLSHFGTVEAIVNARVEELMEVKGVGRKTAEELYKVLRTEYNKLSSEGLENV